jgi:serine/threonine-protein kinase HipA
LGQAGTAGRFRLTPLYDVISAYPAIGEGPHHWAAQDIKLAMALLGKNRHYHMHNIQRRHFNSTAKRVGYGENAEPLLQELIARTPEVVAQVQAELPQGFSQQVADKVLGGLSSAARTLESMPPA